MVRPAFRGHASLHGIKLNLAVGAGHTEIVSTCVLAVLELFLCQGYREFVIDPSQGGAAAFELPLPGDALGPGDPYQFIKEGRGDWIVKLDDGARAQDMASIVGRYAQPCKRPRYFFLISLMPTSW